MVLLMPAVLTNFKSNLLTLQYFHSWFFGKLTRDKAEEVLQPHPEGSFLVRESETVRKLGAYTLSLK